MEESRTLARILAGEVAAGVCDRCGRWTHHLESWLERQRLRTPSPDPGGHRYSHRIVEHMLCPSCHGAVKGGRPASINNGMKIIALAVAGALAIAAGLPLVKTNLVAGFWRNGAAPYGWRAGHTEGRSSFVQGRF
jgi:hypothetical protein